MGKRSSVIVLCGLGCAGGYSLVWLNGFFLSEQVPATTPTKSNDSKATTTMPQTNVAALPEKAWKILHDALKDPNPHKRANAVRSLGLLTGNEEAETEASEALKDANPHVREAAATALGSMHAEHAAPSLKKVLNDSEPTVVLAAANSLLLLKNDAGYDAYYEVLTGERRATKGLIEGELDTLKDKNKIAQMTFEEGIGFLPYAGIGYEIIRTVTKNGSAPVRAAAAKRLAHDPNPDVVDALVKGATDKSWAVRASALEALAQRGDPSVVPRIATTLDDKKDSVRFTAAACIAHLTGDQVMHAAPKPAQ